MKIQLVKYESTCYRPKPHFRVFSNLSGTQTPYRLIFTNELGELDFLCERIDGQMFVSNIKFSTALSWYVDDIRERVCVPVIDLKSIHLIIKD